MDYDGQQVDQAMLLAVIALAIVIVARVIQGALRKGEGNGNQKDEA